MEKNMKFVNVGYGNLVAVSRIVSLANSDSSPMKRLISEARESGRAVDATCGRKTKTVIITDTEYVILSSLSAETISGRMENNTNDLATEEEKEND